MLTQYLQKFSRKVYSSNGFSTPFSYMRAAQNENKKMGGGGKGGRGLWGGGGEETVGGWGNVL